jgi:hypothetical protein
MPIDAALFSGFSFTIMRLALSLIFAASPAFAHGGTAAAEALYFQDQELQAISANFGLLTQTDDGFEWSCFDTLTQIPFIGFFSHGHWFATTRSGLFESDDSGCSWAATEGPMRGIPVATLRASDNTVVALAQRLPTAAQVFERIDGIFIAKGEALPEGEALDLIRRDDGRFLALVEDADQDPKLLLSDDQAASWTEIARLDGLRNPSFLGLELAEGHHAIGLTRGAAGELWMVDAEGALTRRAQLPGPLSEGRSKGDEHWLLTITGVALKAQGDGPFLPAEGPKHCLENSAGELFACDDLGSGHLMLQRIEGGWRPSHPFSSIRPAACSDATCAEAWTALESLIEQMTNPLADAGPSVDAGAPVQPPESCSCSGFNPSWVALGLLTIVRRRRRC